MDLLGQEINNNKKAIAKKKKIILALILICIVSLVIVITMIYVLSQNQKPTTQKLFFNNVEIQEKEGLTVTDAQGNKYVSLEMWAEIIGYRHFNGEYGKNEEDKEKCYLQNDNEVIGFELGSNEIYKINLKSDIEKVTYKVKNKVIKYNEKLYIELGDFSKVCNLQLTYSNEGFYIHIKSLLQLKDEYLEKIKAENKYASINTEYENLKALYYGFIIVSDGQNYGVIDTKMNTIIGAKYSDILFDEYTRRFYLYK